MAKKRKQRKRKKQEKPVSEFRKERTKESKGHSRYLFKKSGKKYSGLKLTHGDRVNGKKGIPLKKNPEPNPKDNRPVNVIPEIVEVHEDQLSKRLEGWKFSDEDKEMVFELIKKLETEKRDTDKKV